MRDEDLFGAIAVQEGFLTRAQLDECLIDLDGRSVRELLLERGLLSEEQAQAIADIQRIHTAEAAAAAETGGVVRQNRFMLPCRGCDTYYLVQGMAEGTKFVCRKCGTLLVVRHRPPPLPAPEPPLPARVIGPYELLDEVGRGALSVVYKAVHRESKRVVALKVLRPSDIPNPAPLRRFQQEARAAGRLSHPNIVAVHEAGEAEGTWYIAMDYVEGVTLDKAVTQGRVGLRAFVEVLETVARAVHHAHQYGVVHRDLKPANILLDGAGRPRVTDFGLAKMDHADKGSTHAGVSLGTPYYMSPEQVEGDVAGTDARSDIYSMGVMLYEALTGRVPHAGGTVMEVYRGILSGALLPPTRANPEAPPALEAVALKALQRRKEQRYASARDFADDLRRWLDGATP